MLLQLKRNISDKDKTVGILLYNNDIVALTLENPYINNKKRISCIPVGYYKCKKIQSPKFGNTFEILDVKNRTHILFHKGNTTKDTLGCILLGKSFGKLKNKFAVLNSKSGFLNFTKLLKDENEFDLLITKV